MSDKFINLQEVPRYLDKGFHLWHIRWMPDHLFWSRNRIIHTPHFCFTLKIEPGCSRSLVNGVLRENTSTLPHLGIIKPETRIHTLAPRRHDELMFTVPPEKFSYVMERFQPRSGEFKLNPHMELIIQAIIDNKEHVFIPGTADRLDSLFIRLLEEVKLSMMEMKNGEVKDALIYELISYLNVHFMENITLEEVCGKFSISLRTLYRRWEKCFDHTPAEFLLNKRLNYAEQLLESSEMNIQEIAWRSGFGNPLYFSQCYRRKFGMSPSSRRKKMSRE